MNVEPTELAPGTWLLRVPVEPLPASPSATNCLIIVDDDGFATIIDPGDNHEAARHVLTRALRTLEIGLPSIRLIIATHLHCDHMGMAARLQRATGAEFALNELDRTAIVEDRPAITVTSELLRRWAVPRDRWPEFDNLHRLPRHVEHPRWGRVLADGDVIEGAGRRFRIFHVPGHTAGHIAVLEESSGVLMTGDVVLPDQNPGIGLGGAQGDALGSYMSSVRNLSTLAHRIAVPGHGSPIGALADRCERLLRHQERRSAEIESLRNALMPATVWSIAERLTWSRPWSMISGPRLRSSLHHVDMHVQHLNETA